MEIFYEFFKKIILALGTADFHALVLNSRAYPAGDYGLSCTNKAYGGHLVTIH